ncbi:FkbM family methyltransferase [Shewanella sp. Scap07]|uniref:FkbM family methyltransferase n=1 Tax=Shewanella sp. Scap07 TaxID=2589987 RepID=UPI0015BFDDE9|nr:FkbM family methyltransferase [Shewanella sp. Scap07]QLE86097.1 FkbM family methyltransferase [Shewanella sp. Scap07]
MKSHSKPNKRKADRGRKKTPVKSQSIFVDASANRESVKGHTINDYDPHCLSQAKTHWYFGQWQALAELDIAPLANNPELATIVAIKAAAYQQLDDIDNCKKYIALARSMGCESTLINKLLISGVSNTLGKVAALNKDDKKAIQYFEAAVSLHGANPEQKLARHARIVKELASIGLMPQAAKFIDDMKSELSATSQRPADYKAHVKVLESEIEIINHELTLAYQKSQLYNSKERVSQLDGSADWLENLKRKSPSQLGQDLWVLEQVDYKRNGFFVEFGATDGVLLSNSFLLEKEFGWNGLCAEPNPKYFKQLQVNRGCIVSNDCIGDVTGSEVEFVLANEYGGIANFATAGVHKEKVEAYEQQSQKVRLETISLHDFLIKHNAPKTIDYMSIDTEGSEYSILAEFPFDHWKVKLFSIEHNFEAQRDQIYKLLTSKGYRRIENQWDDFYILGR